MSIQDLDSRFPISNPDGTPTEYFLRLIRDRGSSQKTTDATVEELAASIDGKAEKATVLTAGVGLDGGGDLSADRTFDLNASLDELNDVDTSTTPPTDGQALIWDDANNLWIPGDVASGGGSGSFRGALAKLSADKTAQNYTALTAIAWDAEQYDTDNIHDNVTNNSRLTVPTGVTKIRLHGGVWTTNVSASQWFNFYPTKNGGSLFLGGSVQTMSNTSLANPGVAFTTPIIEVTPGDYFECMLQILSDTSVDLKSAISYFAMEIIETGGGGGALAPTIIQRGKVIGNSATVTMPSAPLPGNLLVCLATRWTNAISPGSGWTEVYRNTATGMQDLQCIYIKRCGPSESTSQTPFTGSAAGQNVAIWEIENAASVGYEYKISAQAASTSLNMTSGSPADNTLYLAMACTTSSNSLPTITGDLTSSATLQGTSTSGSPRGLTMMDGVINKNLGVSTTATWGSSPTHYGLMISFPPMF